ncbi:MAG: hypothetical protein LKJ83_00540 [Eubacteriaceae bacterium]|jgi:predicted RNA-binding Zn-ribbon protein involved in translation (DUF1610 family)|nr:hypothetical protein [Eubacteriaceae bacterium]
MKDEAEKKLKKKIVVLCLIDLACELTVAGAILHEMHKHVDYICPECGEVFTPPLKEMTFAKHTPKTRKLHCPNCGSFEYCSESYK